MEIKMTNLLGDKSLSIWIRQSLIPISSEILSC